MAKVKRNLRLGPVYDEAERVLREGETMTHFVEDAMRREVARRRRGQKNGSPAEA